MRARILYVEDDPNLSFVTKDNLLEHGYTVVHSKDGEEASRAFKAGDFDLCLLDIMLPKLDGFELAQNIRKVNQQIPIIFLTAKSMQQDKITGLKLGADDYLVKPFSMEELILKIEVFLKRTKSTSKISTEKRIFKVGNYQLNFDELLLIGSGVKLNMTLKEAELLRYLCLNTNEVLKREDILNAVWGDDDYFTGRSLDVFITRLRKLLKDCKDFKIVNIRSVGFKVEA